MEHAKPVLVKRLTTHQDGEAVNIANTMVFTFRICFLGHLLEFLANALLVGRFETVKTNGIHEVSLAVEPPLGLVLVKILLQFGNNAIVVLQFFLLCFQTPHSLIPSLVERLAFPFQCCNLLFQFRFVQQVGVARKDSHVLREVHARLLVHSALVDGSCAECAAFQLRNEHLLAVKKIKFVTVERLFNCIDDDIHLVLGKMLGNLIPCTHRTTVALLQIRRSPWRIQMMNRHSPFLSIDARAEHGSGAEQHADATVVHG